jgi:hypothetical protein
MTGPESVAAGSAEIIAASSSASSRARGEPAPRHAAKCAFTYAGEWITLPEAPGTGISGLTT